MDFAFNDEQQMLLDTTRRFIAGRYSFEHRNHVLASADGWSREVWAQLADLGLLAINIPEEDGGIGAGPVGTMLVGNALGEGLLAGASGPARWSPRTPLSPSARRHSVPRCCRRWPVANRLRCLRTTRRPRASTQ